MNNIKDKIIKETAEKFRKENGNNKIADNDLLIYIMTKIDTLPCANHLASITTVETRQKMMMWGIGIGLSVIGLLYVMF